VPCSWSHARRKFVDAVKLNPQDVAATTIVKRMDDLFAIDAEARTEKIDHAASHALRLKKAPPLLDDMHAQILAAQKIALPKSAAGKAASYTLALWSKLTRFLEHPELELSTNLAENSMRPIAVGRKNWIHLGSAQAGPKIAAIFSVVESCRRLKNPGTRISRRRAPRPQQHLHPTRRHTHAHCLGYQRTSRYLIAPSCR
jgi:transposase